MFPAIAVKGDASRPDQGEITGDVEAGPRGIPRAFGRRPKIVPTSVGFENVTIVGGFGKKGNLVGDVVGRKVVVAGCGALATEGMEASES